MKNLILKAPLASLLAGIMLTGCATNTAVENPIDIITNPGYVVPMTDAALLPSKSELQGDKKNGKDRVIVLPVRITTSLNIEAGAVGEISSKLENGLLSASVEIVDRSLAGELGDEIIAYESTGQFSGSGIDLADVVIIPTIGKVDASGRFAAATEKVNAKCHYAAKVRGNIKMYRMPDLEVIDAITLEGNYNTSSDTVTANCNVNKGSLISLTSKATQSALNKKLHQVKNHFTKSGYVIDYRKRDTTHLVQISIGFDQGIRTGQPIEFARRVEQSNRLSGEKTISEVPYGFSGIVSDIVEPNIAWVEIGL